MAAAGRLIGRDAALAAAESAVADAIAGTGQFVLVSGEAGIGKSAVLAAVIALAEPHCLVLRGSCWEGAGVPPYWPWSQVLRASGMSAAELGAAEWLTGTAAPVQPADAAASADAQFRLFDAVSHCFAGLAAQRPLIVALDDLHWADAPSVALLSFLARTLATDPVLLLGAYRDAEASPQLRALVGDAQQIPLFGLSAADVEAVVATLPGPAPAPHVTAQLAQRSGGNPFFVRELTRLLQAQGSGREPGRLPASVAETLRRRLARLSTACVELLEWAAVAGRDIEIDLLVRSGAAPDEITLLRLLTEASEAGLVTAAPHPHFVHDLYRDTILEGLREPARARINLAIGRTLQDRPGSAARIATHLLNAGPADRREAVHYCIQAGREATARLGHDEACAHFLHAMQLLGEGDPERIPVLLELAAAHTRSGRSEPAMQSYRDAAVLARDSEQAALLAEAALGMQSLGQRSGAQNAEVLDALLDATERLENEDGPLILRSRVLAATARVLRHGSVAQPDAELVNTAERAVRYAQAAGDADALAAAKLAVHDVMWVPGTARIRLPVIAEMLDAARAASDAELVAQAHLLRATALLEMGDPAGRDELLTYVTLAGELGTARGRWGALTRKATYAQLAGHVAEAAALGEQALELGQAIHEPDALGCFCTSRWSLVALGIDEPNLSFEGSDPLWPLFPLVAAWPHAVRGDLAAARQALGDFSVLDIRIWADLEAVAVAAVVFAAVGTEEQRRWAYAALRPYAGMHVIVGGCAAYHAAVDHHLGMLAAALGELDEAEAHLRNALVLHQRLGAPGWAARSGQELDALRAGTAAPNQFIHVDGRWLISFGGKDVRLPESKGLHDLWVLIGARGSDVHVRTLLGADLDPSARTTRADVVLDDRARAEFKARLATLDREIDDADELGHSERADRLRTERDALINELAAATGLRGRARRLGDQDERARKTVSARVRDTLGKIDVAHPELAFHLRQALRMGTTCSYVPAEPISWKLA